MRMLEFTISSFIAITLCIVRTYIRYLLLLGVIIVAQLVLVAHLPVLDFNAHPNRRMIIPPSMVTTPYCAPAPVEIWTNRPVSLGTFLSIRTFTIFKKLAELRVMTPLTRLILAVFKLGADTPVMLVDAIVTVDAVALGEVWAEELIEDIRVFIVLAS